MKTESKMIRSSIGVKSSNIFPLQHAPYFEEHTGEKSSDWSWGKGAGLAEVVLPHNPLRDSKWIGRLLVALIGARRAGFAKGTFTYIAPDFDAPLEDFVETRQPGLTGPIMFVGILLHTWRLSRTDAIPLLGLEKSDSSYARDLLSGRVTLRGRDIKDRIAYLFRIRKTLSALFRDEEVENEWLREPHDALDGQNPMALLLEGSMENLLLVKEYVEAAAGR